MLDQPTAYYATKEHLVRLLRGRDALQYFDVLEGPPDPNTSTTRALWLAGTSNGTQDTTGLGPAPLDEVFVVTIIIAVHSLGEPNALAAESAALEAWTDIQKLLREDKTLGADWLLWVRLTDWEVETNPTTQGWMTGVSLDLAVRAYLN